MTQTTNTVAALLRKAALHVQYAVTAVQQAGGVEGTDLGMGALLADLTRIHGILQDKAQPRPEPEAQPLPTKTAPPPVAKPTPAPVAEESDYPPPAPKPEYSTVGCFKVLHVIPDDKRLASFGVPVLSAYCQHHGVPVSVDRKDMLAALAAKRDAKPAPVAAHEVKAPAPKQEPAPKVETPAPAPVPPGKLRPMTATELTADDVATLSAPGVTEDTVYDWCKARGFYVPTSKILARVLAEAAPAPTVKADAPKVPAPAPVVKPTPAPKGKPFTLDGMPADKVETLLNRAHTPETVASLAQGMGMVVPTMAVFFALLGDAKERATLLAECQQLKVNGHGLAHRWSLDVLRSKLAEHKAKAPVRGVPTTNMTAADAPADTLLVADGKGGTRVATVEDLVAGLCSSLGVSVTDLDAALALVRGK